MGESIPTLGEPADPEAILANIDFSLLNTPIEIDHRFLDRPNNLPLLKPMQTVLQLWLEAHSLPKPEAEAIAKRLPAYFVYSLNQEWRKNAKAFKPILEAIDTPFAKAGDREWAWTQYAALLQRQVDEGVFDESFSLSQIFIQLNAYYLDAPDSGTPSYELSPNRGARKRITVSLADELDAWAARPSPREAIRVISGGPGSGKSSFAKIFAARLAGANRKVLFVPLHLIDPSKDLIDAVGHFVKEGGILQQNPLNPESPEPNLLIIFDGLDELASQGKTAATTARDFVREVEKTVERRNSGGVNLQVLISGRELSIQENESEFRQPRQILFLLPYFSSESEAQLYTDPKKLLKHDLRNAWWTNYGSLTGRPCDGIPKELRREDLDEITAQPLLNYLVALSFSRGKLDFSKDVNLNLVYADLVSAVYQRGYEKHRPYASIRHMTETEFFRVLEEIGLAAWHGDGRTTTVREIADHCNASGLASLLDAFKQGAESGVTRLLAAFFFRQYGQRASGDATFVFTHKSFGEYLAAKRIVRAMDRMIRELSDRKSDADRGWTEAEALKHWAQICGPSPMTTYLRKFIVSELSLRQVDDVAKWQDCLADLFSYMVRQGMPMELLPSGASFKSLMSQSRNAEEGLLVALNACALKTQRVSQVRFEEPTAFGAWFKRIQGQRTGDESSLAASCLTHLHLGSAVLYMVDFYGADLERSILTHAGLNYACLYGANLRGANLQRTTLAGANLEHANLTGAELRGADIHGVRGLSADDWKRLNLPETT